MASLKQCLFAHKDGRIQSLVSLWYKLMVGCEIALWRSHGHKLAIPRGKKQKSLKPQQLSLVVVVCGIIALTFVPSSCTYTGNVWGEGANHLSHLSLDEKGVRLSPARVSCGILYFHESPSWIDTKKHKECKMIINHNLSAINAHRVLKFSQWEIDKSMAKLSSGMRINKAGDDPSGLAVSEKMRTQIQGLRQAERNTEDGLSLLQTAEGYLGQVSEVIQRIRVLAIQASNGIYGQKDRQLIQGEVSQLVDEVDRISNQAEYNRFPLFLGAFSRTSETDAMWLHVGPNANQRERVYIEAMTTSALGLRLADNQPLSISTPSEANDTIGRADHALDILMQQRAELGAYQNRLEHTAKGLMNAYENVQASESQIRDTDMAEEVVNLTSRQILAQTAVAMLAQAGVRPYAILHLLK